MLKHLTEYNDTGITTSPVQSHISNVKTSNRIQWYRDNHISCTKSYK
jgi:hypothetical protein